MPEKVTTSLPQEAIRFLDHLSVERGASKNTLTSYRHDLEDFFNRHQGLSQLAVTDYVAQLRSLGLSESTIARRVSTLRSLEAFLSKEDATRVPWRLELRKSVKRLPKSLSYEVVRRLLESASDDSAGLRDRAILEVLYATGMRVSECVDLDLNQLSDHSDGITFLKVRGKGGKERMVPIGGFAKSACEAYLVRSRPDLVSERREAAFFVNNRGERLTRQGVWQILKRSAVRVGIEERVTPHVLRHSFATHMLERGADIRSVQELLGHASVVTTQVYTLITQDVLREAHAEAHPRAR